ncbi:tetratricopeptide repeat protein [Nonomuraea insulae]|uniref:Tetratricopeptide repeat protein n=1 Tax=Nonomuraea insulae TaxID=1616787 RepID=A0ABW1D872_9ACTN
MGRIERARLAYERAVFAGDGGGVVGAERELDQVEADLAVARGRLMHARFLDGEPAQERELELFETAVRLYRGLGDVRGEGEGLFWVGVFLQVVRGDHEAARPALERSRELAEQAGDKLTLSYALRHLGIAEHVAGRLVGARERLEESVRLRKEVGFSAGVAANLVGLAHVAVDEGRRGDAVVLLDEAEVLAEGAGRVMRSVEEARGRL